VGDYNGFEKEFNILSYALSYVMQYTAENDDQMYIFIRHIFISCFEIVMGQLRDLLICSEEER